MSCKHYQRLMHLNRAGELSQEEAEDLRQHVRLCERCALELQRLERADQFFDHLSEYSPVPSHPGKLTADILHRIKAEPVQPNSRQTLDLILDFFLLPAVRYASVAVVLLVTGTFMVQLTTTLDRISELEQRMASPGRIGASEATYTIQSKTLQEVAASERGKSFQNNIPLTVTNNHIAISAKDVDTFLAGHVLDNLPAFVGTTALGIDKETFDKIVNEVKATAELTFRFRREGA